MNLKLKEYGIGNNSKARFLKDNDIKKWIKQNGHEVVFDSYASLEEIANWMIRLKNKGFEDYYTNFAGHYLYTIDTTMDSAFMEVYGKTYDEWKRENVNILKK